MRQKAYSYIRFSDPSQATGDTYRRQHAATVAYCKEKDLDLVSETAYMFFDKGVSAYSGKLRSAGTELSRFLSLVQDGSIKPGSVLIVESLDRLSRENVRQTALPRFLELLGAGISIHTLHSGKTYTPESNDDMDLFQSILEMSRSHHESKWKAERIADSWKAKQDSARRGIPMGKTKPAWLDIVYDTHGNRTGFALNERVEVVKRIFQLTIDGYGRNAVAQILNKEGIPAFKTDKGWGASSIQKLLTSETVLGIYQPSIWENGKRVPRGEAFVHYLPIIDRDTFDRARAATSGRNDSKARRHTHRYQIWQGIAKCLRCQGPLHTYSNGRKNGSRYLRCYSAKKGLCDASSIRLDDTEVVFKEILAKLNVLALVQGSAELLSTRLEVVMGQLAAERAKLADHKATYKERQSPTIRDLIYEAEDAIQELEKQEQSIVSDLAASQIVDKEEFFAKLDLETYAGRSRANSVLKRLKVLVYLDPATYHYKVDKDGLRVFDVLDQPTVGIHFYPVTSEFSAVIQTQEGTFTPSLAVLDDGYYPDE